MKIFKNKLISVIAACALSVNTFSVIALANTGFEGDGSFENPYIISKAEDFTALSEAVIGGESFDGKYFVQTSDFEFENAPANETVVYGMGENEFGGIYDGGGNKIILADTYKEVCNEEGLGIKKVRGGLFGKLSGVVKNVTVTGSWRLDGDGAVFAKTVIGNGKIINCGISDFKALHAYDWGTVFYGFASTAGYDGTAIYNCFNYSEEFITSTDESYPITDNPSAAQNCYYYLESIPNWAGENDKKGKVVENENQKITGNKMAGLYSELNNYIETLEESIGGVDKYGLTLWKSSENAPESKKEYYTDPVEVEYDFEGEGTYENPYVISGAEDFVALSEAVAGGNSYEGKYFLQTSDFEFENAHAGETVVYGMGENEFGGIYDGGGNKIILADIYEEICNKEGLGIKKVRGGLFGRLSGVVKNITVTGSWRLDGDGAVFAKTVIGNGKIINCGISDFKALHPYDGGTVFYGFASTAGYDGTAIYNCFNYSEEFTTSTDESYPITDNPSAAQNCYYYLESTPNWAGENDKKGKVVENENQKITGNKMAGLYSELNSYIETLEDAVGGVDKYSLTLWKSSGNAPESKKEYYSDPIPVEFDFEGEGTYEAPYLIGNADDFNRMLQYVKDGISDLEGIYFSQTADISFVTAKFGEELVYGLSKGEEFAGVYNGNGYKITMGTNYNHIASYEPEDMGVTLLNQGLFGRLSGLVMNVTLRGYWRLKDEGGLIAHSVVDTGKIINCSTQNFGLWAIFGSHPFFGFASTEGYSGTAIYNCFFTSHYSSNPDARIYLITDTDAYKDCWYHLDGLGVSGKVDLEKGTPVKSDEVKTVYEKLNAAALVNAKAAGVQPVDICTWKASDVAGSPIIEKYELVGAPVFDGATFTYIGIEGEAVAAAGESYVFTAATHFKDAQNIKVKLDDEVVSEYVVDGVYENIVEIPAGYMTEGKHTVTIEGLDGNIVKYTAEKMIVADAAFITNVRVSGELISGSEIKVKADIENCMSDASDITLLIGVYNERGKLVAHGISKYPAVVGDKRDAEVSLVLPQSEYDGCKAYLYIWNNIVSMKAMREEMLILESGYEKKI